MIALVYDVHANLPALEAVLDDAAHRGATEYLLGGDYTSFGAWPAETVQRLDQLQGSTWIRGNWDRWLQHDPPDDADDPIGGAARFARAHLDAATIARLGDLQDSHRAGETLYCHGSPHSDMQSFLPEPRDEDAQLLEGVDAARVIFGHFHLQFRRTTTDGVELCNPGSVGLPLDGDTRAAYALVSDDGRIELRRVDYDHARAVDALRVIGEPWAEPIAGWLERGRRD